MLNSVDGIGTVVIYCPVLKVFCRFAIFLKSKSLPVRGTYIQSLPKVLGTPINLCITSHKNYTFVYITGFKSPPP